MSTKFLENRNLSQDDAKRAIILMLRLVRSLQNGNYVKRLEQIKHHYDASKTGPLFAKAYYHVNRIVHYHANPEQLESIALYLEDVASILEISIKKSELTKQLTEVTTGDYVLFEELRYLLNDQFLMQTGQVYKTYGIAGGQVANFDFKQVSYELSSFLLFKKHIATGIKHPKLEAIFATLLKKPVSFFEGGFPYDFLVHDVVTLTEKRGEERYLITHRECLSTALFESDNHINSRGMDVFKL